MTMAVEVVSHNEEVVGLITATLSSFLQERSILILSATGRVTPTVSRVLGSQPMLILKYSTSFPVQKST